jgi:hypothetical protein
MSSGRLWWRAGISVCGFLHDVGPCKWKCAFDRRRLKNLMEIFQQKFIITIWWKQRFVCSNFSVLRDKKKIIFCILCILGWRFSVCLKSFYNFWPYLTILVHFYKYLRIMWENLCGSPIKQILRYFGTKLLLLKIHNKMCYHWFSYLRLLITWHLICEYMIEVNILIKN